MTSLEGLPILSVAAMRAAEDAAIARGASVGSLMQRAGEQVAEQVRRLAAGNEVLFLCGPGNNGGDGYVAAGVLAKAGLKVRVAALAKPRTAAARGAREEWGLPVEDFAEATAAPIVVDALFGTGMSRGLDGAVAARLHRLLDDARLAIAVDLPSGVSGDDGALLGDVARFDVTLALGALKPAHFLQPSAALCGAVRLLDIGVAVESDLSVLAPPRLSAPGPASHKYSRGMVAVVAGAMPGAAALAATSSAHSGAGYVLLLGSATDRLPHAIVRRRYSAAALADERIGAIAIGPGLGRDEKAHDKLVAALATAHPLVIDGDALHLLDPAALARRSAPTILTPHAGEFAKLFGEGQGSKIDRARAAAKACGATIVFKGADTVIAHPDGAASIAPNGSGWLSTAGTGDVLAGAIAALLAGGHDPLAAACGGAWLHGEAARRCGTAFVADDLALALPRALARCL